MAREREIFLGDFKSLVISEKKSGPAKYFWRVG